MSDRAPRKRSPSDEQGEQSLRGEARRFLGTPMQSAMIRGLDDERRARIYLGVANELHREGEVGKGTVEKIAEKVREDSSYLGALNEVLHLLRLLAHTACLSSRGFQYADRDGQRIASD